MTLRVLHVLDHSVPLQSGYAFRTLALLREIGQARLDDGVAIVAIAVGAGMAMLEPLRLAAPILAAGAAIVLRTDPSAPSALVALAELTARCGFPPGVFNVVHGRDAMLQQFRDLLQQLIALELPPREEGEEETVQQ